jgi:hypothetical protein
VKISLLIIILLLSVSIVDALVREDYVSCVAEKYWEVTGGEGAWYATGEVGCVVPFSKLNRSLIHFDNDQFPPPNGRMVFKTSNTILTCNNSILQYDYNFGTYFLNGELISCKPTNITQFYNISNTMQNINNTITIFGISILSAGGVTIFGVTLIGITLLISMSINIKKYRKNKSKSR